MSLICIECGKEYDPEGWDPMGGDCPRVRDSETGEVITPGYFVIGEDSIQLVNVPTLSGFLCRPKTAKFILNAKIGKPR